MVNCDVCKKPLQLGPAYRCTSCGAYFHLVKCAPVGKPCPSCNGSSANLTRVEIEIDGRQK